MAMSFVRLAPHRIRKRAQPANRKQDNILLALLAIFFPPLAVILEAGWGWDLTLNLLFCLLAWVPGILRTQTISGGHRLPWLGFG